MENYQLKLEDCIKNKQCVDSQLLKNIVEFVSDNITSSSLLDLVLTYLENYPQQVSLISKSNKLLTIF